ncbi:MAG TPA: hypothetical protein VM183_03325 [Burkholderiales bacterium]|nr:hypothetical protein [Burkholderiales bacterium]
MSAHTTTQLTAGGCTFTFERPAVGVMVVTIQGFDKGELGDGPLKTISSSFGLGGPLELFIDASGASGAAKEVSDAWTRFFAERQKDLKRVHVLVGSKVVQLTIAIAQHLSRTGNLVQLYSDPEIFADRLRLAREQR